MQLKLADRSLLQRWCMLQLHIAAARSKLEPIALEPNGEARLTVVNEENLLQSRGYIAACNWFKSLSPGGKAKARLWMFKQVRGVEMLKAQVEKQGDAFDYGELELSIREAAKESGLAIVGPDEVAQQTQGATDGK